MFRSYFTRNEIWNNLIHKGLWHRRLCFRRTWSNNKLFISSRLLLERRNWSFATFYSCTYIYSIISVEKAIEPSKSSLWFTSAVIGVIRVLIMVYFLGCWRKKTLAILRYRYMTSFTQTAFSHDIRKSGWMMSPHTDTLHTNTNAKTLKNINFS